MNKLITALATPYKNGKIDSYSYEKLVNFQIENGVDTLLAVGTTAEAQLLYDCEKKLLVKLTKAISNVPVFVGIEGHSTKDAVRDAVMAEKLGADGLLVTPPAFVKCTPQGYLLHIKEILKAVSVPLMLYNAPSRCNYVLDKDTVIELSNKVQYLKDAGNDLDYTATLSKRLAVMCGNDFLLPHMLKNGATGVVSVVSNVAPKLTREILNLDVQSFSKSSLCEQARRLELFQELANASMLEVSPIAIKYMLYKKGIFDSYEMRLPLTAASEKTRKEIDELWSEDVQ